MTKLLQANPEGIQIAADLLRNGFLVSFGTETVYGLGGDATNAGAVAGIFKAKGRPHFNPLICHFSSADDAFRQVEADERARRLAASFWPGPLTLILRRRPDCPVALLATAGLDTLAVRVPNHPAALSLARLAGVPIAAPSANLSGSVSPTSAQHVLSDLDGRIEAVLDTGPCIVGLESTVLDLTTPVPILLRPGGVPVEELEARIGAVNRQALPADAGSAGGLRSPGMLSSHYAPVLPVRLNATGVDPDEALLAFGPSADRAAAVFQLSAASDTSEAAARLFGGLRWLDQEAGRLGLRRIAVMPIPLHGLGLAINDRLKRAAAPRA